MRLRSLQMALNPDIRFRDPAAQVVWAALCTLEEAAQHELLTALQQRLAFPEERLSPHAARVARGVAALREVAALVGRSPSVGEYRRLRDQNPERRWPDDSSVRQWLGGNWNDALTEAGLDALPDPIAHHPERGPHFSDEELLAAIRECANDLGQPIQELSFQRYLCWARSSRVRKRPGRRPQGQLPYERFDGWTKAKAAALGVEDMDLAGAGGRGYRYTEEQVFTAADEISRRLGRPGAFPGQTEWVKERRRILVAEERAGKPRRAIPGKEAVRRVFDSWQDAAEAYVRHRRRGAADGANAGGGSPA